MIKQRVQRYILKEISIPMGLGLFLLTFVLLMGNLLRLTDLVINKGVPFRDIIHLFILIVPSFLGIALFMSFLLGILIGFGRLSSDSEIIAMKASGISISTMFKPVLLLALVVALINTWVFFDAKPRCYVNFKEKLFDMANNRISSTLQPMIFYHDFEGVVIYAEEVDNQSGRMRNIFLHDYRDPAAAVSIFAQRGAIFSSAKSLTFVINLEDGTILHQSGKPPSSSTQILRFDNYDMNLSFEEKDTATARPNKPKGMTMAEVQRALAASPSPEARHNLKIEWHKRMAMLFVPFLFALIGVPLGIHSPRSGKIGGFSIAIAVFLTYFMLSSFAETMCRGALPFYTLLWAPDMIFLAVGVLLFYCARREISIFHYLPAWPGKHLFSFIHEKKRGTP